MSKLKTLKISLVLRPHTKLKPKMRNKTRWSSTFEMIERYFRFKDDGVLDRLLEDEEDIEVFLLSPIEERRLRELQKLVQPSHRVTLELQNPNITFARMRGLFDHVMLNYATMNQYIATNSTIVHSPCFESALAKISSNQSQALTDEEKESVEKLKLLNTEEIEVDEESTDENSADSFIKNAFRAMGAQTYVF